MNNNQTNNKYEIKIEMTKNQCDSVEYLGNGYWLQCGLFGIPKTILSKAAQEASFFQIGDTRPVVSGVVEDSPAETAGIIDGEKNV